MKSQLLNYDPYPQQSEVKDTLRWVVIEKGKTVIKDAISAPKKIKKEKHVKLGNMGYIVPKACGAIGYTIACDGEICKAHIISRQYRPFANSSKNIIEICKGHETYFNKSGNDEWYGFVKKFHKEKFEWIMERCDQIMSECESILRVIKNS